MRMMLRRHIGAAALENAPNEQVYEEPAHIYSKTDINRMSKSDLLDLAKENGMEVDEYTNGNTLKDMLIEKLVK